MLWAQDIMPRLARSSLKPLSEAHLNIAPDRIDKARLIAQRDQSIAIAHVLNIVKDIVDAKGDAAASEEFEPLGQGAAIIKIDEGAQVQRCEIGKTEIRAGEPAIHTRRGLVLCLDPKADAVVEPATFQLKFVARLAAGGSNGRSVEQVELFDAGPY